MSQTSPRKPPAARRGIGPKVRQFRQARRWTQAELASRLDVSQGRLSQLERGEGSFTAEQFLTILELFNVGASDFVPRSEDPGTELQNVLARLGAAHLQESASLPSERIEAVTDAVRETLVSASAARLVAALAPVLVLHADAINFHKLELDLRHAGLVHRLTWLIENTLHAVEIAEETASPAEKRRSRRAAAVLGGYLESLERRADAAPSADLLDTNIRSAATRLQVQAKSSEISKRWHLITAIQPADFVAALEAARDA